MPPAPPPSPQLLLLVGRPNRRPSRSAQRDCATRHGLEFLLLYPPFLFCGSTRGDGSQLTPSKKKNRELLLAGPKKNCSAPAMKASDAAVAVGSSSDIPIYISSDENDPYSPEDLEIQEAIVLSLDSSGAATAASASSTNAFTALETPPDRKGKRKLQSEGTLIHSNP
jgi:hypothetical protein